MATLAAGLVLVRHQQTEAAAEADTIAPGVGDKEATGTLHRTWEIYHLLIWPVTPTKDGDPLGP